MKNTYKTEGKNLNKSKETIIIIVNNINMKKVV